MFTNIQGVEGMWYEENGIGHGHVWFVNVSKCAKHTGCVISI